MKLFISWSRPLAREVGSALHTWLPAVLNAVEPWMSSKDIYKGTEWFSSISTQLQSSEAAIVVITHENVDRSWLHFEAGALWHRLSERRGIVAPVLIGVTAEKVQDTPLSALQMADFSAPDMLALVASLNQQLGDRRVAISTLEDSFEVNWPRLQSSVLTSMRAHQPPPLAGESLARNISEIMLELQHHREATEADGFTTHSILRP